ncbi:MAG: T9SS type A sorting domain-containing protein, partial [Bacteroidales bacterium]|nr:T9SS type A sorting domain-containing protein [Bacteroidales bacterium]
QRIIVDNAINIDWESLATDDDYIYIGDFGNNLGNRDDLAIYIVSKSDIPLEGDGTAGSTKITFIYSDYKGNTEKKKEHNFDCEAFIATNDSLYLFSKNRGDQKTKLYRLPKMPGDYIAELISTFNVAGLITGADINISSDEITLIGYVDQSWIPFTWLLFDYEGTNFFGGNKRRIDLLNIAATQTEAISYTISKHEVITSEGNFLFSQTAYNFNSALWTDSSPSMILDVASNKFDFSLSPNPVSKSKLTIHINKLPKGEYQIEIFDTFGRLIRIKKYNVSNMDGANKIKIKVGDYTQGTYFVRMRSGNQVVEKKFIKK